MRKTMAVILCMVLLLTAGVSLAEEPAFEGNQALVFETMKWCLDIPKDARALHAMEYENTIEGQAVHVLLIHITQNEAISRLYGNSACIVMVDLDTMDVYTYANLTYPESGEIASKEDALKITFACYDSIIQGINEGMWGGPDEKYTELTAEELEAVNQALMAHFVQP